jgi:putative membrane-bound dehydrogenase-like protein
MNQHAFRYLAIVLSLSLLAVEPTCHGADTIVIGKVTKEDMPKIPLTKVTDALDTFRLAKGFSLEMVASEPQLGDPVDACFDEFGRMFVAEMHGYPFSHEPTRLNPDGGGKKDAGIIRMLEDTNGDGRMDKSVVFASGLNWPTSVCCYNGGLFVLAPQYLLYLKDTDDDDVADVREIVLSGFGRGNVQSVTNGLKWDLDNNIYFAAGRNPIDLLHRGKTLFPVNGSDLRFDPKTESFEQVAGGVQFGHSMDNWGVRFVCSNSNHMQQVVYPRDYLARNPYFVAPEMVRTVATDGASARVFRRSPPEPWRIVRQKWRAAAKGYNLIIKDDGGWEFIPLDPSKKKGGVPTEYPAGFFTSATGITIYRGNAYPAEYRGNAFVGDVGGNLVHRKIVDTTNVVYKARRADEGEEIVASSDNWFRPVNFVNAPDGSLYVLDMYRETIEHPYSIPAEIKEFLHLTNGWDRGRVYRLVSPNMQRHPVVRIGDLDNEQLVQQLASDNGWNRETAQRLIWERQDQSMVKALNRLLASTDKPLGRLHSLYALQGLNALTLQHVRLGLADEHPRVQAHAIRMAEVFLEADPQLIDELLKLSDDQNEHVRFQLAFTLGESTDRKAIEALARLSRSPNNSAEVRTALMSSVGSNADQLAVSLLQDREFRGQGHAGNVLSELALVVGANPEPSVSLRLLEAVASDDLPLTLQQRLLTALGEGLARRGFSIAQLLNVDACPEALRQSMARLFIKAMQIAGDEKQSLESRETGIRFLAFATWETAEESLLPFLLPQIPQQLQRATIASLAEQSSNDVAATLLEGWRGYSPQIRRDVVEGLLSQSGRLTVLLDAVETGAVRAMDIEVDKRQMLVKHPDKRIRSRCEQIFKDSQNTNRTKVVDAWQDALNLEGDSNLGLEVFKKKCSICHQVGEIGHKVAPDLASVKNKSAADLLIAILDPNREAQPNFNTYTAETKEGRIFSGIIAAESANSITLRRAEAKQDVVLRSNIEGMISNGISLMPEGLEKEISRQDLANVIAFVKTIGK